MLEAFEAGEYLVSTGWDGNGAPLAVESAILGDELGGICPMFHRGWRNVAVHADVDIVAHFKMKMGGIHAAISAYGSNLLAALHALSYFYHHLIEVTVKRIDEFHFSARRISICVTDQHDISPTHFHIMSEGDDTVGTRVNGCPYIGVSTGASVPIFAIV
jgi:hypothetical protein